MNSRELSLYGAFRATVELTPEADAVAFPDMVFSYEKIDRLVQSFAASLVRNGVDATSLIQLRGNDMLTQIAMLLSCAALNARVVQDSFGHPLPEELEVTHHFHVADPAQNPEDGSIAIDASWSPSQMEGPVPTMDEADPAAEWLYVYTSGTTGLPKFVPLSQAMVTRRSYAVAADFIPGKTRFATTMPAHSRAFLARGIAALLNGATIIGSVTSDEWITCGATMISGSVTQMMSHFNPPRPSIRFPIAEVFGSRLSDADGRILAESFDNVHDVFGATETNKIYTSVLSVGPDGTVMRSGHVVDGEVEVVDHDGVPVPAGVDGNLRIRNTYSANRYVGDATATDQAFRDGWFYTGDAASWDESGNLSIRARLGHVFNLRGAKINGFLVDQVIRSVAGIRDAVAFQNPKPNAPDELFAFVVYEEDANRVQAAEVIRLECEERLGASVAPAVIQGVAGIPRADDGTVDRAACQQLILHIRKNADAAEA
mmetsp:Transcript_1313/g.2657  ORF Transcript_1313/g.2657 Transcript_1313/m.2657 type:complete len:486 (+) Transcript_1313:94-1551(+)